MTSLLRTLKDANKSFPNINYSAFVAQVKSLRKCSQLLIKYSYLILFIPFYPFPL